jgi:hypothetical protein
VSPRLDVPTFVARWQRSTLTERSAAQQHFLDLCAVLGEPTPAAADPDGTHYTFEKGTRKTSGAGGWADVWLRRHFAWEYKGKHKDLTAAYRQIQQYREDLENPSLLVVCDLDRFEVHTNFTNTVKAVYAFDLADLARNEPTPTCALPPLEVLRATFTNPERLRPARTTAGVTEDAAREFAALAESLRRRGEDPEATAHFLMRVLFCLFAEDIDLLPAGLFTRLVAASSASPGDFGLRLRELFARMATGGFFGEHKIPYFNGGLFADDTTLALTVGDVAILARAAALDWASIEPAIFGTLFERSLDPAKRSQLGAHYTSREDILLIVEPVLIAPLHRRWVVVQEEARALIAKRDAATNGSARTRHQQALERLLLTFTDEIAAVRVLDPACGSGNFLYVSLKRLLDLWKEVSLFAAASGVAGLLPYTVGPQQLYGVELNVYAHELASVVVWIGYIQWLHDNGFGVPDSPILKPLHNIRHMDAVLAYDEAGRPMEPAWPEADVIIGNPPFVGGNKVRQELGDAYVDDLFRLYQGRVPAFADFVCYWFERARALVEAGRARRIGLLATNSIRGGVNRRVLERIAWDGQIFMAWGDRPWVLNGAAVRVSMVGFDGGAEQERALDGLPVVAIYPDLTATVDLSDARQLAENRDLCVYGSQQKGSFDITPAEAHALLAQPNAFGRNNADVVKPSVNGQQILRRTSETWVIDFGVNMPLAEASLYEAPFEYVKRVVYPERQGRSEQRQRDFWWLHARPSPRYREIVRAQRRYIASPTVSKHRVFVWLDSAVLADHQVVVFARDDDYVFGVLHSKVHRLWALRMGTALEDRPRYTPSSTFETFPFPWVAGREPAGDIRVQVIATAACELVERRDQWLNPPGLGEVELRKRTLTSLYNSRPTWLALAHDRLDRAVLDAYSWPHDLADEEILGRLLALNLERAGTTDPPALPIKAAL